MAAGGTLPLRPPQIASVLFALSFDPDPDVKARAQQSLGDLPGRVLDAALPTELHPGLLHFFAEQFQDNCAHMEKLALNPATSDETYCYLASLPHARIVEIVSHNQTRLMRCSPLVEALSENPLTGQSTIDRILSFLGLSTPRVPEPEEIPEIPEPLPNTADAEAEAFDPDDVAEMPDELMFEDDDFGDDEENDGEDSEQRSKALSALIQDMTIMEKIKLGRFGNSEARSLLVRDRNKVVASAAIRSPKIKNNEVVAFSKSRALCEEVYRIIASTTEWTKNYQVKLGLATNPKTPLPAAIKFLNYLTDRDLKQIMRSRDVPGQVSVQARRILSRKGKI